MSLNKSKNHNMKYNTYSMGSPNTYNNHIYSNSQDDILNNLPLFILEMNEKVDALAKASTSHTKMSYVEPEHGATGDFTLGSLVEVSNDVSDEPLYGVIRWMGMELQSKFVLVGIELEEELPHLPLTLTDGTHNGERLFRCSGNRALFVPLKQCHKDSRFQDGTPTPVQQVGEKAFIKVNCMCGFYEGGSIISILKS